MFTIQLAIYLFNIIEYSVLNYETLFCSRTQGKLKKSSLPRKLCKEETLVLLELFPSLEEFSLGIFLLS
jgi:hypothetical protein